MWASSLPVLMPCGALRRPKVGGLQVWWAGVWAAP